MSRISPTVPTTQQTPNAVTVYTQSGFNQGDLVYYQNGDYKSLGNLTAGASTTASFNSNVTLPILAGDYGGIGTPVFNAAAVGTTDGSGTSSGTMAAILSNGNIVQVFFTKDNFYPAFRVVDSSGNIIVAKTNISTSYIGSAGNGANISVCALSGGGFAVVWVPSSSATIYYAVYTNSGAVTTAATADATGAGNVTAYQPLAIAALPNGGFVVAFLGNTPSSYFKIYTATGGTTKTWTLLWAAASGNGPSRVRIAVRSNNNICFLAPDSSGNVNYAIYNAAGTAIVSQTSAAFTYNTGFDVCCLADGSTFVLGSNGNGGVFVKLLPSSNTLGSGIQLVSNTTTSLYNFNCLYLVPQAAGGFCFIFGDQDAQMYVGFSNASATTFYPQMSGGVCIPIFIPAVCAFPVLFSSYVNPVLTTYELSGNIVIYLPSVYAYASAFVITGTNTTQISINESTYTVNLVAGTTSVVTNAVTQNVTSPAVSTATPTQTNYVAATTSNVNSSQAMSLVTSGSVGVSSVASLHNCTLTNGNFVVATCTGGVYAYVFNPTGTLLTTVTVTSSGAYNAINYVRCFALPSGQFGVAYGTSSGTVITVQTYSATYALLNTVSTPAYGSLTSLYFDACGSVSSNTFCVLASSAASTLTARIYSGSSGALLQTINITTATNAVQCPQISPDMAGGYYGYVSYPSYIFRLVPTGTNTWSTPSTANNTLIQIAGTTNNTSPNFRICANTGGYVTFSPWVSSTTTWLRWVLPADFGLTYYSQYGSSASVSVGLTQSMAGTPYGYNACGMTGFGSLLLVNSNTYNTNTGTVLLYAYPMSGSDTYSYPSSNSFTLFSNNASLSSAPQFWVTPLPGYSAAIVWLDSSSYPRYAIVNAQPALLPTITVTAGVSVSNASTSINPKPATGTGINGAILAGVANTLTAPNAQGMIITNGIATLNSNYPSNTTAQGFDYQQPNGSTVQGVKGTIVGRNVTLTGNN